MKKRPREPKPLIPVLATATGPALIKHLASCNTTVRSQALRLLQSWLVAETQQLSDSDIKKLWKGLFYCLWHSDKTPNQLALINRLTSLFLSLQSSLSLEFFRGFLVTLRREWPGIDRLRLDKFYLLIRRFMKTLFELMRLRKWDVGVLGEYFRVLQCDGFLAEDKLRGNGVNYHIASVFLEELKGVGFPVTKEVVDVVLGPFFAVMKSSEDRILLGKVKSCVFDELVKSGKEVLDRKRNGVEINVKDGGLLLGVLGLKMGLSGRFYEVGSSTDCVQGNRKVALGLHEEFLKLEKDLESSDVEICIPEYSYENGVGGFNELPQLIPIDFGAIKANVEIKAQEGAGEKIDKKKKRAKKGVDGDDKKKKKKKKRNDDNGVSGNNVVVEENNENMRPDTDSGSSLTADDMATDGTELDLNENVILNLQKQFENVAAEMDSKSNEVPLVSVKHCKRKRTKGVDRHEAKKPNVSENGDGEVDAAGNSVGKSSAKKVRFSMKNNLVWKPQTPLPPENLRLPPAATPRGSALKKGVPPGPVIEMPKKGKKKRAQNRAKSATSMMKRRKKMQTQSASA